MLEVLEYIACVTIYSLFVMATLLWGLICLSDMFSLDVPMWLVWLVVWASPITVASTVIMRNYNASSALVSTRFDSLDDLNRDRSNAWD